MNRGKVEDYPFDSRLVVEMQIGLDKLRCVKDRSLAKQLFDLYWIVEQNERDPGFHRREAARRAREEAQTTESLAQCATAALEGDYGPAAKELASAMLFDDSTFGRPRRTDRATLEAFASELRATRRSA